MLRLLTDTDPRWTDVALGDLGAVLHDHLHCEMKAASNSTALLVRYPMHARLVTDLAELAREELTHVQQVSRALAERGISARPPGEDAYAKALRRAAEDRQGEPLLDRLIVGGLIEARSCERFQLLSRAVPTEAMRRWYHELFVSEARHHRLFCSLAEEIYTEARARTRWETLAAREAEILAAMPIEPRIH